MFACTFELQIDKSRVAKFPVNFQRISENLTEILKDGKFPEI